MHQCAEGQDSERRPNFTLTLRFRARAARRGASDVRPGYYLAPMRASAAHTVAASKSPWVACGAAVVLIALVSQTARADTHCYGFRNDSAEVATLSFSYHPAIGNVITGAAIEPGKAYPFDGRPWCWNLPEGTTATVAVVGPAVPQWKGTLVLGNGTGTAPSGTYAMGGVTVAAAAPVAAAATATQSGACLANTYPNNETYCLTALETDIHLGCGVGHTGISGAIVVNHLTLTCRNGRSLKLTCGTATGGRQKCNLNDHQICTDDGVRSAADYCGR